MNIFIGIDPSMNSTGICIQYFDKNMEPSRRPKFIILKSSPKLTKKEQLAETNSTEDFSYEYYNKQEVEDDKKDDNHYCEFVKTANMIALTKKIKAIIKNNIYAISNETDSPIFNIWICQEGISYGSVQRTKSVFDLAGLNYLIRQAMFPWDNSCNLIIATPAEIKKFATGMGNANKDLMLSVFKATYPNFDLPKLDDVADAYFMSNYAIKQFDYFYN